jgi:hypothetical protein
MREFIEFTEFPLGEGGISSSTDSGRVVAILLKDNTGGLGK